MNTASTFSRPMLIVLVSVCGVSLLVGLALAIFQDELGVIRSAGSDTFSYSALGHHGYRELLERLDYQVLVSRNNSGYKASGHGVLVIAEPDLITQGRQRREKFTDMCFNASTVLVVLPKRKAVPDPARPNFAGSVFSVPDTNKRVILEALGLDEKTTFAGHSRDLHWDQGAWNDRPFIDNVQLIDSPLVAPLIACEKGTLLGHLQLSDETPDEYWYYSEILILSDPDLLANHGLRQGQNAAIAVKAIDYLDAPGALVIFDETLHGFEVSPSIFRSFFRIPLVFVLVQILLTAAALLWLANGRFGSTRKQDNSASHGLHFLIDNTAELLDFGGHGPFVLGRYHQAAVAGVCRQLHLDLPGTSGAARQRLVNISEVRSPDTNFSRLETQVREAAGDKTTRPARILALARSVHRWQQEMTHGN